MRYWVNGEDEDFERECERVRRFGGVPPSTSGLETLGLALVYGLGILMSLTVISGVVALFH